MSEIAERYRRIAGRFTERVNEVSDRPGGSRHRATVGHPQRVL